MLMGSIGGQPQKRMGMLSPTSMIMQVGSQNVYPMYQKPFGSLARNVRVAGRAISRVPPNLS